MKKILFLIYSSLIFLSAYGQKNDYFGSVIIPKNEYIIRLAGTNSYWQVNNSNQELLVLESGKNPIATFMFIPAGDGYYFIKYQLNGNYVNVGDATNSHDKSLKTSEPKRNDEQKFKIVGLGNNHFKFITINNMAVEYSGDFQPSD